MIAYIKRNSEHPVVQTLRDKCIDLQQVKLLSVKHKKFGQRWLILDDAQISTDFDAFVAYVEDTMPDVQDTHDLARTIVLHTAPRFADDPVFLEAAGGQDGKKGAIDLLYWAAAFLLECGITDVDQDTTDINFTWLNRETST